MKPIAEILYGNCRAGAGVSGLRGWGIRARSGAAARSLPSELKPLVEVLPQHGVAMFFVQQGKHTLLGQVVQSCDFEQRASAFSHVVWLPRDTDIMQCLAYWGSPHWHRVDDGGPVTLPHPCPWPDPEPVTESSSPKLLQEAASLLAAWINTQELALTWPGNLDHSLQVIRIALDRLGAPLRTGISLAIGTRQKIQAPLSCWLSGEDQRGIDAAVPDTQADLEFLERVTSELIGAGCEGFLQAAQFLRVLWLGRPVDLSTARMFASHTMTYHWPSLSFRVTEALVEDRLSTGHTINDASCDRWVMDPRNQNDAVNIAWRFLLQGSEDTLPSRAAAWAITPPDGVPTPCSGWSVFLAKRIHEDCGLHHLVCYWQHVLQRFSNTAGCRPEWTSHLPKDIELLKRIAGGSPRRLLGLLAIGSLDPGKAVAIASEWPTENALEVMRGLPDQLARERNVIAKAIVDRNQEPVYVLLKDAGIESSLLRKAAIRELHAGILDATSWLEGSDSTAEAAAVIMEWISRFRDDEQTNEEIDLGVARLNAMLQATRRLGMTQVIDDYLLHVPAQVYRVWRLLHGPRQIPVTEPTARAQRGRDVGSISLIRRCRTFMKFCVPSRKP